jgi:hypothetical protein
VLEISAGAALAFECTTVWGNPCARGKAKVADTKMGQVYPAHLDQLDWYQAGRFVSSSYVVVGVSPGQTTLEIAGEAPLGIVVRP